MLWEDPRGRDPEGGESSMGRKPPFLEEEGLAGLGADQENKRPGVPLRGHLPGGTPEEMVEADTWP